MSSFVTLAQFEARYQGVIPGADEERLEAFLEDASALVADIVGSTYTEETVPPTIVAVVCTAVRRAYENPSGLAAETTGAHSWTAGVAGAGVFFTPGELRMIRRAAGVLGAASLELESSLAMVAVDQYVADSASPESPILYFAEEDLGI
jgi:class 3 adenylate cyclase